MNEWKKIPRIIFFSIFFFEIFLHLFPFFKRKKQIEEIEIEIEII